MQIATLKREAKKAIDELSEEKVKVAIDFIDYLKEKEEMSRLNRDSDHFIDTKTGRPCGDERFLMRMEKLLGRELIALPKGRPRKTK